jgi:uncharacterized protein (TIGR02246 family)
MKKTFVALVLLSLTAVVLASGKTSPKHGLVSVDHAWVKAMLANDAGAVAELYADDAVLVLPGTGAIKGKKAIAAAYEGWLKEFRVTAVEITPDHYESSGNVSTGWGAWTMTTVPRNGGAAINDSGTFTAVALKRNGVWKYAADHASGNPAPAK